MGRRWLELFTVGGGRQWTIWNLIYFLFWDGTTVQYGPTPPYCTSPSQLCFLTLFPVFNLHLLISVYIEFYHLFFGRPLSRLPWGLFLNTWLTFLLLSVLLRWTLHFNCHMLTNKSMSKFPDRRISSLLQRFLQFWFTLIPKQSSNIFSFKSR
jgi:hypothetical protein